MQRVEKLCLKSMVTVFVPVSILGQFIAEEYSWDSGNIAVRDN